MASMANMCLRNIKVFSQLLFKTKRCPNAFVLTNVSGFHNWTPRTPSVAFLCCNATSNKRFVTVPHPSLTRQLSDSYIRYVRSYPALICGANFYSTQKTNDPSSLTSDILKSKIGEQRQSETESQRTQKQEDGSSETKDSKKPNENSWFHAKHAWKLGILSLTAMSLLMCGNLILMWGSPIYDNEGKEIEDEFSILPAWQAYPKRAFKEAHFFKTMIEEPSYKKLLPEPLKEPWYQPPYTLVIELTGVLVHPDWTLGTGWRFKKRPAVTYFLQQVASPMFEVVIFTKEQGFTAFPIIDGLDPNGHVTYRLFRDATRYMNGAHVKDLENLNRDLSKVILVDCDPKAIQKQPRNAVLLKTWKGADEDRTLVELAAFLKTIAVSGVEDVRPVLEHYSQFDDPLEAFKENQRRLQGEQERSTKTEQQEKSGLMGFGRSFARRR